MSTPPQDPSADPAHDPQPETIGQPVASGAAGEPQGDASTPAREASEPARPEESGHEVTPAEVRALVDPATVHRTPRYGRFALAGIVVGLVLCAVLTMTRAIPTPYISLPGVFLLIAVFAVPFFALLGLTVAVVVDRGGKRPTKK